MSAQGLLPITPRPTNQLQRKRSDEIISPQSREEAKFGVMQFSPFRNELDEVMGHCDYLAQLANYLGAKRTWSGSNLAGER